MRPCLSQVGMGDNIGNGYVRYGLWKFRARDNALCLCVDLGDIVFCDDNVDWP